MDLNMAGIGNGHDLFTSRGPWTGKFLHVWELMLAAVLVMVIEYFMKNANEPCANLIK